MDAYNGAICEAIERACLMTSAPDDPRTRADPGATCAITPLDCLNYSANQLQTLFAHRNHTAIKDCLSAVENLWMICEKLSTTDRVAVPAAAVLFGEDTRNGLPPLFSTSTGTALRDTREAAIRHAVLELVERDLVALWWYNRLPAPRLDTDFVAEALPAEMAEWLASRRRRTHHLLMPSDLPVSAVVAISTRADGSRPAIGAAAALDPAAAVRAATLELLQGEIALGHMRAARKAPDPPPAPPLLAWSEATNARAEPFLAGGPPVTPPPATTFDALTDHFAATGIEVLIADLTRPELGVPVVKALSPQLRDWLPRFGPGRLYDVPVALGLRASPTAEADLNPVPFVI